MTDVRIIATGKALPTRELRNEDLTQFPASALSLIKTKTGVEARRHCAADEKTSDLALRAAQDCLQKLGVSPESIAAIFLSTSTPDRLIPATAAKVQAALGARNAFAFDLNSVCSGGLFALETARVFIAAGVVKNALVLAADCYSKFLNPKDFSTYPYFGDGAAAVLLTSGDTGDVLLPAQLKTDGAGYEVVTIKAGGAEKPYPVIDNPAEACFSMNGRQVFEFATTTAAQSISDYLVQTGINPAQIASLILHQANINIVQAIAKSVGVDPGRCFTNLQHYGNTSSAGTLIALDESREKAARVPETYTVLCAFGGGLSWAVSAIRHT